MSHAAPIAFRWNGEQEERWLPVVGFPEYQVSDMGRVKRVSPVCFGNGTIREPTGCLKTRALPLGHLQVTISTAGIARTFLVHRLVALAFLGRPAVGWDCVLHKDDNPGNNRVENLYWGDRADNASDRVVRGRHAMGERAGGAKLTEAKIKEIRKLLAKHHRQRLIAVEFGVSQSLIAMIKARTIWGHVP